MNQIDQYINVSMAIEMELEVNAMMIIIATYNMKNIFQYNRN